MLDTTELEQALESEIKRINSVIDKAYRGMAGGIIQDKGHELYGQVKGYQIVLNYIRKEKEKEASNN